MNAPPSDALKDYSRAAIADGSKSFALASHFFDAPMRDDAQMLYAWCRYCDDVIDGQTLGADAPDAAMTPAERARRLDGLKSMTRDALNGGPCTEPAFEAFRHVALKHRLPDSYPLDLLDGFAHDVTPRLYLSMDDLLTYCYGVAGVVGVMMAIVMGVDRDDVETLDRACDLGLAFQLTNICRDIMDDAAAGRVYLPQDVLAEEGLSAEPSVLLSPENKDAVWRAAVRQLRVADAYYESATEGVRRLPTRAAAAIAAARNIYRAIGARLRAGGPEAWRGRVYVAKRRKMMLALAGIATGAPASIFLKNAPPSARAGLWMRPRRLAS
ncbi:MAG: phytoene/squalene synthase family protein [Pseudomonadota bacterium]